MGGSHSGNLEKNKSSAWCHTDNMDDIMNYADDYKHFLNIAKTERECAAEIEKQAKEHGFINLADCISADKRLTAGDRVYSKFMDKAIILFVIGKEPLEFGMNLIASHIDSPRLDLKADPLYESMDLALMKTHYYGGIKKYQWASEELALHGVVMKKDGTKVNIVIGEDDDDPVFYISDLAKHISAEQMNRKLAEGLKGEELNLICGSISSDHETSNSVKYHMLELLYKEYGISEEDLYTAELEAVPARHARDLGFDRSMITAYGQDDKICAYAALRSIFEIENPSRTIAALFMDKEEAGSIGATGAKSRVFENTVAEIQNLTSGYNGLKLRRILANSSLISADVIVGLDPTFQDTYDLLNTARIGGGVAIVKYVGSQGKKGSNDANAETLSRLVQLFDSHGIAWQTGEAGKVDLGGSGTIAWMMASYGMEVADCGAPLLSMHAPCELASKADAYETYRAYGAFLQEY